jgi:hypothetical protein
MPTERQLEAERQLELLEAASDALEAYWRELARHAGAPPDMPMTMLVEGTPLHIRLFGKIYAGFFAEASLQPK